MKVSSIDTSAEAEILIDKELITFTTEPELMIKTVYHGKIKVLKKSGLDRGTIKLRCLIDDNTKEYINNISGFTHNLENGTVVTTSLPESSIFREKLNDEVSYTKIIAPNLKVGSVFEFKYTRNTPLSISTRPAAWYFQGTVPVRWSEVDVIVPSMFLYKAYYKSYFPFEFNDIRDTTIYFDRQYQPGVLCRYAIKDIPAFREEPYVPSPRDCIAGIEFEMSGYQSVYGVVRNISGTWKDVYKFLNSNEGFGKRLNKTAFLAEKGRQFEAIKDTMERIDSIFKFITSEYKWDGELGLGAGELYKCHTSKLASGTELNMLLVALLRYSGLKANMAVISSNGNGKLNLSIPRADRFDFAIAQTRVNGKDIFMDATEKYAKPNMLPYHSAVKDLFIIEPDSGRFSNYKSKDKRWSFETINYELNTTNFELKGNYEIVHGGYQAVDTKRFIENNGKDEFLKTILKDNSDWQIDDLAIEDKGRKDGSVKVNYVYSGTANHQNGDKIYFNPLHELRFVKNPFEAEKRIYPIDFVTPLEQISMVKFIIPDGYEIIDLPIAQNIALPEKAGKYSYFVELKDRALTIRSHLSLSRCYFDPEENDQLRDFFNIVVESQAKQILIKKI
jgi:hypothetical protein